MILKTLPGEAAMETMAWPRGLNLVPKHPRRSEERAGVAHWAITPRGIFFFCSIDCCVVDNVAATRNPKHATPNVCPLFMGNCL